MKRLIPMLLLMAITLAGLAPVSAVAQWATRTIQASDGAIGATYTTSTSQSQLVTSLYFNSRFGWINHLGARACMDFVSGSNSTAPASSSNTKELCLDDGEYALLTSNVPVSQAVYLRMATGSSSSGHAQFVTW